MSEIDSMCVEFLSGFVGGKKFIVMVMDLCVCLLGKFMPMFMVNW